MQSTTDNLQTIKHQVAFHTQYINLCLATHDYGLIRLYDSTTDRLVCPADLPRRFNDFVAAAYVHALALNQSTGYDCIDGEGHCMELKLAYIHSKNVGLTSINSLTFNQKTFDHGIQANWKVHKGTARDHHSKDTAFILIDGDHNCFITGFVLKGEQVEEFLHGNNKQSINRKISLSQFIKHGYEIDSSVPNLGWKNYYESLHRYILAREGQLTEEEADEARQSWIFLRNTLKSF